MGAPFRFGQEAVILFFLLSGFVIFANERDRATVGFGYYYRRIRRIYPPLIVALVASTVIFWINGNLGAHFSFSDLGLTLLNLQDISALKPGVIVDPYLGNDPLWSLSYEMAFYIVFPIVLIFWKRSPNLTTVAVGIISILSYCCFLYIPNHFSLIASYFLIWWCGAMAAAAYMNGLKSYVGISTAFAFLALLAAVSLFGVMLHGYSGLGVHPFLELRHFGAALLFILVGMSPLTRIVATLAVSLAKPAKAISSVSYGVYVLHYPLLVQSNAATGFAGLAMMVLFLVPLAYFADPYLNRVLPRWEGLGRLKPT